MLLIFLPIFLLLTLQSLSVINSENVLVNAPTFLEKHLDESILLARILAEDGHQVHLLFMNSGGLEEKVLKERIEHENKKIEAHFKGKEGASGSKSPKGKHPKPSAEGQLTYEIVKLPSDFVKSMKEGDQNPHNLVGNKWQIRGTTQNEKILENEAFHVYREFLESPEAKKTMHDLKLKNFKYGLFDTWDFGAQYIFFLLGIPNVQAFNKISLLTYQMKYANPSKQLPKNFPEVYSTQISDALIKKGNYFLEHEKNLQVFINVHHKMEKWFKGKKEEFKKEFGMAKTTEWPSLIRNLYGKVENVFMDSLQALDFELGEAKPVNAHYIGGITLVDRLVEKKLTEEKHGKGVEKENPRTNFKLVIVSLELCEQLVDKEENHKGFQAFLDAFKEFGSKHSDKKMHFQIDCKDEKGKMRNMIKDKNVSVESVKNLQNAIFNAETRLLISSCSGGPVIDALGAGVPLICVPLMVDQYYISQALQLKGEHHGKVSIALDTNKIMKGEKSAPQIDGKVGETLMEPKDAIKNALETILVTDAKTYLDEAHKLQEELHKSAFKAKELFLVAFKTTTGEHSEQGGASGSHQPVHGEHGSASAGSHHSVHGQPRK